ncbi:YopT-type cysteine protease domain-containing protein [Yersinia enterocolitica]
MAVADKRISNKIPNISPLRATANSNTDYVGISNSPLPTAPHSSFMNWVRKQGMGKYVHNKHDKALSFDFSQTTAILLPRARDIYNLGKQHVTNGSRKHAVRMFSGICFGLSAKYMIAARNYGPEGAKDYFSYIESLNKANPKNAKSIINSNVRKIYNGFSLSYDKTMREKDLLSTLKMHKSQSFYTPRYVDFIIDRFGKGYINKEVNTKDYLSDLNKHIAQHGITKKTDFDERILSHFGETASPVNISNQMIEQLKQQNIEANKEYGGELAKHGLKTDNNYNDLKPDVVGYVDTMKKLENPTEDTFVSIQSQKHAMAIAIHKKESGHIWSFFEPNYGGVSFHDYKSFKKFMDGFTKNRNSYASHDDKEQRFSLEINIYTSNKETKKVDGVWDSWRRGKDEFIINEFKNSGAVFKFDKKTNGKVVDFTTRKDADNNLNVDSVTIELSDKKIVSRTVFRCRNLILLAPPIN